MQKMYAEVTEIEQHFKTLCSGRGTSQIDFWGINIPDFPKGKLTYKVYLAQKASKNGNHPLIEYVQQKGMLRYFSDVADSTRPGASRIDISLYQRNDANLEGLFSYLSEYAPFFEKYIPETKKVAAMKITDEPGYRYAALYHVGLIENNSIPEAVKFHFFTRWCENPNRHTKEGFRDNEFLAYLRDTGMPECRTLAEKASFILRNCSGHVWMVGMDIFHDKIKYKIYLKDIHHAYEYLPHILGPDAAKHLQAIADWDENHMDCHLAGVAIALDTTGTPSLNVYYHVD